MENVLRDLLCFASAKLPLFFSAEVFASVSSNSVPSGHLEIMKDNFSRRKLQQGLALCGEVDVFCLSFAILSTPQETPRYYCCGLKADIFTRLLARWANAMLFKLTTAWQNLLTVALKLRAGTEMNLEGI